MGFEHLVIASLPIPADAVKGTTEYNAKRILPKRMRYFNPIGYVDLKAAADELGLVFSDIARTPEAQIVAKRSRKGSQTPDRSGHVVLLSVDLSVNDCLANLEVATRKDAKKMLDEKMAEHRFYCHRRDHKRAIEDWHYNWIPEFERFYKGESRTSWALERWMQDLYGKWYAMDKPTIQRALRELRLYGGAIDGIIGPQTKAAVQMFQSAYFLKPDGVPGLYTQRMLAVATATYSDGHGRDED